MNETRTPFRISFVGGGSDMPGFFCEEQGQTVTMAINKYMHIYAHPKFDGGVRLSYMQTENVRIVDDLQHDIAREVLKHFDIRNNIEIHSIADIPAGTGLGSSSAYAVGLINAVAEWEHHYSDLDAADIADLACRIEIERCGKPIGKQDQYATALGGAQRLVFNPDGTVEAHQLRPCNAFLNRLLLFYVGATRSADAILMDQQQHIKQNRAALRELARLAPPFAKAMEDGDIGITGEMLDHAWQLKRSLSPLISDSTIDILYSTARNAGAIGGKLLGAGGTGFLLFFAQPDRHDQIKDALAMLRHVPFRYEPFGTSIDGIYRSAR